MQEEGFFFLGDGL